LKYKSRFWLMLPPPENDIVPFYYHLANCDLIANKKALIQHDK